MAPNDPFSKLPSPIVLSIVKLTSDLSSFRNLDKASPTIASLFNECGPEIIEAIIATSLPEQIRSLIRVAVLVRSDAVQTRSLDAFIETYLDCERVCRQPQIAGTREQLGGPIPALKLSAFRILSSTPILVLREILDLADQIQHITDLCLTSMISRCMSLKPSHLLDPEFQYIPRPGFMRCPQRRPLGVSYVPKNSGAPSWVEEGRAGRALWRIQLFLDLQTASRNSKINWSARENILLQNMSVESFWKPGIFGISPHEQLRTIVEFCHEQEAAKSSALASQCFKPLTQLPNVDNVSSTERPIPRIWKSIELDDFSPGHFFMMGRFARGSSPMRYQDFTLYRRLGCYIWDLERMAALGLLNHKEWQQTSPLELSKENLWFTWESLLSKEELDKKELKRLESFPESVRAFGSTKRATYWHERLSDDGGD